MSSGSKSQTIGYEYTADALAVLCARACDMVSRIKYSGKIAHDALSSPNNYLSYEVDGDVFTYGYGLDGDTIVITARDLLGGSKSEGGIAANATVLCGAPTQAVNPHFLESVIAAGGSAIVSALRGVTSVFFWYSYWGNSQYLKPLAIRATRIYKTEDGADQWYSEKAGISNPIAPTLASRVYVSCDNSGSMAGAKITTLKAALHIVVDNFADASEGVLRIVKFSDSSSFYDYVFGDDTAGVRAFIDGMTASGGTNAMAAYGPTGTDYLGKPFFSEVTPRSNVICCVSDGEMEGVASAQTLTADYYDLENDPYSLARFTSVQMRGVGIETAGSLQYFDNSGGSVPVISADSAEQVAAVIIDALSARPPDDMNPTHILRELIVCRTGGMGYTEFDVDGSNFMEAADRLHAEKFGLSVLWADGSAEDLARDICNCIDAKLFIHPRTGLFTIKLIRDDYVVDDLPVLGVREIRDVSDYKVTQLGELPNSVTVTYWNSRDECDATVQVDDVGSIIETNGVRQIDRDYSDMVTSPQLAQRIAERDLRAAGTPTVSCKLYCNRMPSMLVPGDPFIFDYPDLHDSALIMRVLEISLGGIDNQEVVITCGQDVFSISEGSVVGVVPPEYVPPSRVPLPTATPFYVEAPYRELLQRYGSTQVDADLADNPDAGLILATAEPASNAVNCVIYADAQKWPNYADFAYVGTLDEPLLRLTSVVAVTWGALGPPPAGSLVQIDDELLRFDGVDGGDSEFGRAQLDTVPRKHAAGSLVWGWDLSAVTDGVRRTLGDVVQMQAQLRSDSQVGAITAESSFALGARAIRPYPPADVKVNGSYWPTAALLDINLTWAERNRLTQGDNLSVEWTDGTIAAEVGTTYVIRVYDDGGVSLLAEYTGISGTSYSVPVPPGADSVVVRISAERDGYESWQYVDVPVEISRSFGDDLNFVVSGTVASVPGDPLNFVVA